MTSRRLPVFAACLLAAVAVVGALPPTALAGHGSEVNYTVVALESDPGNPDATYEQFAVATADVAYLDYIRADWQEGGFSGCGPTNSEVFGIDRDDDDPGTTTDEDLTQYVEETTINEDTFKADFYERDDAFGTSTNLATGDQFVALTRNCLDNPDEPGWYQISAEIAGTDADGNRVTVTAVSHYFYVCDCASEREARKKLGPPPSEGTPTPSATATPTAEPTPTPEPTPTRTPPAEGTPFPSPTPTAAQTAAGTRSATPGAASGPGPESDGGDGNGGNGGRGNATTAPASGGRTTPATAAPTTGWDDVLRRTPTDAAGPGFGPLLALAALLVAVALRSRW